MHYRSISRLTMILSLVLATLLAFGCSDDTSEKADTTSRCDAPGIHYNPELDACVVDDQPDFAMVDMTADTSVEDTSVEDTSVEDTSDVEVIDPSCDKDRDGALSIECGGDDCDDENIRKTPGKTELCDDIDNNCDNVINEQIDCGFYAHTSTELYNIDPFNLTATLVAELPRPNGASFNDIDTHPVGDLYGITSEALYVKAQDHNCIEIPSF